MISVHNGDDAVVEDITFRNIVVEHEEVGSGDAEEMPYLIDLNIMQNSNWSTTAERGQIRNIVLENVNFLEGTPNGCRIQGFDQRHRVENVTIENLTLFGKKIKAAEEGIFHIDADTVDCVQFR